MYDRCTICGSQTEFVGISRVARWLRWTVCPRCRTFHANEEYGVLRLVTKEEPHPRLFRTAST